MQQLLIIETRDAADHRDPARMAELAASMCGSGVPATIFLAENGTFNARGNGATGLQSAMAAGVSIAVDRFAIAERGISESSLQDGVCVADVDLIVDRLADGACVMWR